MPRPKPLNRLSEEDAKLIVDKVLGTGEPEVSEQPKQEKVDWVKAQKQTRDHTCHWPKCGKQCKPSVWGCWSCWCKLPRYLRDELWKVYRPGQEVDGSPSIAYCKVARKIREWIYEHYPETRPISYKSGDEHVR